MMHVQKTKAARLNRAALRLTGARPQSEGACQEQLFCCCLAVFVSKALNTSTHVVHRFLCTCVKGV